MVGKRVKLDTEIIYRIEDANPDDGIPAADLGKVIFAFVTLISESNKELGDKSKIEINIKPFERGSFITDFIVGSVPVITELFTSPGVTSLVNTLGILGFIETTAVSVPELLRRAKGKVDDFNENEDGTFTYNTEDGSCIVTGDVHKLVQNTNITKNYYSISAPTDDTDRVIISSTNDKNERYDLVFSKEDQEYFKTYNDYQPSDVDGDEELNVTVQHGIMLQPMRGSYIGDEKDYDFVFGENAIYKKVIIDDEEFLDKIRRADVRLSGKDILKVDLEITQKIRNNGVLKLPAYRITRVIEYIKYNEAEQLSIK